MLTPWAEFDRAFESLRSRLEESDVNPFWAEGRAWSPPIGWKDTGPSLEIVVEVPGFTAEDLKVDVNREVLTVAGERKLSPPAGYRPLRRERGSVSFSRSISLPVPVDSEQVSASLKNGVLTLSLPKQAEVRPRSIPVHSQV